MTIENELEKAIMRSRKMKVEDKTTTDKKVIKYLSMLLRELPILIIVCIMVVPLIIELRRMDRENEWLYERVHYADIDAEECWNLVDEMELEDETIVVEENNGKCCCVNEDEQVECNHLGDPD